MIALVTGAYRGLGLETVKQLAEMNYTVVLTGRKDSVGLEVTHSLNAQNLDVHYHYLDVNSDESIQQLAEFMQRKFGVLDVLVNNAAVHYDMGNNVAEPNWTIVNEAVSTNFIAPWKLTSALLPLLKKSSHARIVNVSSGAGSLQDVTPGTPAYSTTKAVLNMLTIQFAGALKAHGIKVNAVCPGWVRTDMGGQAAPRSVQEGAKGIVWAATLPDNGPTGGFFRDGKPIHW